jgi:hypothetical protein
VHNYGRSLLDCHPPQPAIAVWRWRDKLSGSADCHPSLVAAWAGDWPLRKIFIIVVVFLSASSAHL